MIPYIGSATIDITTTSLLELSINKEDLNRRYIYLKKMNGKNVYSFHNFTTGDNYNTFNEIPVTKDMSSISI